MAENTNISWSDHTWSPWYGCTQVSMGERGACVGCYARQLSEIRQHRVIFGGPGRGEGTRDAKAESGWKEPLKWERAVAAEACFWDGYGPRYTEFVFPSLCDPFDNHPDSTPLLRRFFDLIRATPHLTWLLLTKRPGNIVKLFNETAWKPTDHGADFVPRGWPRNAAIGCTVVTQDEADRDIPKLLAAKAALNPAFAFVSMEPLLSHVDISRWLPGGTDEAERAGIPSRDSAGLVSSGRRGAHLAACADGGRVRLSDTEGYQGRAVEFGAGRLSEGDVSLGGQAPCGLRPQDRLDGGDAAPDPGWDGNQPQGWGQEAPAPRQSRTDDPFREHAPQLSGARPTNEEAARLAEHSREADRAGRASDQGTMRNAAASTDGNRGTLRRQPANGIGHSPSQGLGPPTLDWVITGGETDQGSHKARPSHPDWFRSVRDQCAAAGVPYHHKQNGEWMQVTGPSLKGTANGLERGLLHNGRTTWVKKVGKRHTGRTLDGVIHDARPEVGGV